MAENNRLVIMSDLQSLTKNMLDSFEAKDKAREESLRLSREVIRICSFSIRSIHRGELNESWRLLNEAGAVLKKIHSILKDHQDIRYAGFVDNAEQEYAEAKSVNSIVVSHDLLSPEEIGVDLVNYLSGLGDATGELRRHILDLIRNDQAKEGEFFLNIMEEIFNLLMLFDYPDALTRGLRRKSDLARSMLEKTRGDLTRALELQKVENSFRNLKMPEKKE